MENRRVGLVQTESGPDIRVWASSLEKCNIRLYENRFSNDNIKSHPMQKDEDGFFSFPVDEDQGEICYDLQLESGLCIPDPYADDNVGGIHGRSISNLKSPMNDSTLQESWSGVPIAEAIIMEIHVGAFTTEGTYGALCEKLDALKESGVSVIQLMPLLLTPGNRNWGYDPVSFFTLNPNYGSSAELKYLIEMAHQKGISVIMDVVYNHLGPEGSYFSLIAKNVFDERERTPWGNSINLSGNGSDIVRQLILQSVEKWMSEFSFDGVRVDAGEYLRPDNNLEFLMSVAAKATECCKHENALLVLEYDLGQLTQSDCDYLFSGNGYNLLWNKSLLHEAYEATTECVNTDITSDKILTTLKSKTFASHETKTLKFVNFLRSHDTIGNSGVNSRNKNISTALWLDALPILLLNPSVPMIFMGDDWMADTPFHYFCDLKDTSESDFITARTNEFQNRDLQLSRPMAEETFVDSTLNWNERNYTAKAQIRQYFARLIEVRRRHITPILTSEKFDTFHWRSSDGRIEALQWQGANFGRTTLACVDRDHHGEGICFPGEQVFSNANLKENRKTGFATTLYKDEAGR